MKIASVITLELSYTQRGTLELNPIEKERRYDETTSSRRDLFYDI